MICPCLRETAAAGGHRRAGRHQHGGKAVRGKQLLAWAAALVLWAAGGCGGSDPAPAQGEAAGEAAGLSATQTAAADSPASASQPAETEQPARSQDAAAPGGKPRVEILTSLGRIVLELDPEKAPLTVENFLRYVKQGYYDGTVFHQVFPGYVILGGGYTPDLKEKPAGVPVRNEADNGLSNRRGTVALARDPQVIDSGCCQFFINVADNPQLDHQGRDPEKFGYCVFGRVVEGMDVVDKIAQVPAKEQQVQRPASGSGQVSQASMVTETLPGVPVQPVLIRRIRVLK